MAATDGYTPGSGSPIAADSVNGQSYEYVKLTDATVDSDAPIGTAGNPLPVVDAASGTKLDTLHTDVGSAGNTPPALATGASGVVGWLRKLVDTLAAGIGVTSLPGSPAQEHATAGSPGSVRLSDGGSYLGTTAGRLQVDDGGGSLTVDGTVSVAAAGDVAATLTDGRQTVGTPGTAVALRASLACKWVTVTALLTNTTQVNVGGSGALATAGGSTGTPLSAGGAITIPVDNASKVFVDARTAGEGVSFTVAS